MHTVRNRLASRPPVVVPSSCVSKLPAHAAKRLNLASVAGGSMAIPLAVADECGLIEQRRPKRRNPKGKKARKAAARLAELRAVPVLDPASCAGIEKPRRTKSAAKKGAVRSKPAKAVRPEQLPAIPAASPVQGTFSLPVKLLAAPALRLPVQPEPLVEQVAVPRPVLLLPPPQPEPGPEPEFIAALADAPLPKARALVPARRQGLVDVIAFLLRDSGRRLARWSARRQKSREERAALRTAEARQINLLRELEALDALRRNRG